jgi:hypothetical protein
VSSRARAPLSSAKDNTAREVCQTKNRSDVLMFSFAYIFHVPHMCVGLMSCYQEVSSRIAREGVKPTSHKMGQTCSMVLQWMGICTCA